MRKDFWRNRTGYDHSESHRKWAAANGGRLLSVLSVLPGEDERDAAAAAAPCVEDRSWEAKITEITGLPPSASR